ncbi:MAG: polyphosphate kinase 2 family protein [Verrucomicrobium sp.]|nr:polyphosphate kinase 2 family protein [Verrucomicrobium sp.]
MKPVPPEIAALARRFRVVSGAGFRLKDRDPACHGDVKKEAGHLLLKESVSLLSSMQERLYAQDRAALLLIFQAMDAAGKDGTIKHVMSGVNPQGCQVTSFKAPNPAELAHDYLWRTTLALPERGRIGIFNRSYYEEVLIARVHPKLLENEKLPARLVTPRIWKERLEDIAAHERHLARNGTVILKFFLHLSKKEQKKRFLSRLEEPEKNWKFSAADLSERGYWDAYQKAYEEAIRATAAPHAPWFVIPADHKWFARLAVAAAVIEAMRGLNLHFPEVTSAQRRELAKARNALGER